MSKDRLSQNNKRRMWFELDRVMIGRIVNKNQIVDLNTVLLINKTASKN